MAKNLLAKMSDWWFAIVAFQKTLKAKLWYFCLLFSGSSLDNVCHDPSDCSSLSRTWEGSAPAWSGLLRDIWGPVSARSLVFPFITQASLSAFLCSLRPETQ